MAGNIKEEQSIRAKGSIAAVFFMCFYQTRNVGKMFSFKNIDRKMFSYIMEAERKVSDHGKH